MLTATSRKQMHQGFVGRGTTEWEGPKTGVTKRQHHMCSLATKHPWKAVAATACKEARQHLFVFGAGKARTQKANFHVPSRLSEGDTLRRIYLLKPCKEIGLRLPCVFRLQTCIVRPPPHTKGQLILNPP